MLSKRLFARSLASLSSSSSSSSFSSSLSSAACSYSLSSPSAPLRALRPFSSAHSPLYVPAQAPSLADITPDGAAAFEARQKEFRARTAAAQRAKEEQDSQSARQGDVSTAGAGAGAAGAVGANDAGGGGASAASAAVPSGADTTPAPTPFSSSSSSSSFRMGLGSLSTHTAEAQDERAADASSAADGSDNDGNEGGKGARSSSSSAASKAQGALSSLIYGTKEGRLMDREIERSYSQVLARGKYVHSIVFHRVKPDKVDEYVELVGGWYPRMASMKENKVNLVGSWRTDVGDCDTFVHIWEYQRYQGYHASRHSIAAHPDFPAFDARLRALLLGRDTSLMQEFSFWPTTAPRQLGGLFELRSYTLRPGNLLEWESYWRRGLAARRDVMEGVGAWFVQIGELNTVHHLWQFADLEERKLRRERSWGQEGWSETVHRTVPLIQTMKSRILIPMPWSPVA